MLATEDPSGTVMVWARAHACLAVQLRIELADLVAAKAHQRQKNEHNQAAKRETALARLFFVVLILVIFFRAWVSFFGLFLFGFGRLLLGRLTLGEPVWGP